MGDIENSFSLLDFFDKLMVIIIVLCVWNRIWKQQYVLLVSTNNGSQSTLPSMDCVCETNVPVTHCTIIPCTRFHSLPKIWPIRGHSAIFSARPKVDTDFSALKPIKQLVKYVCLFCFLAPIAVECALKHSVLFRLNFDNDDDADDDDDKNELITIVFFSVLRTLPRWCLPCVIYSKWYLNWRKKKLNWRDSTYRANQYPIINR